MTLMVETESHGEVESGFYSTFTQFARLGEYAFSTRHFCELVQYFAKNPQISKAQILGYDLDKFWEREEDHMQEITRMIIEAGQSYLPELQKSDTEQLERHRGEVCAEDEVDLYDEGRMVPVDVADDESAITIGEYRIPALHFGRMAVYLAMGGFMGWMNEQKPEFAEPTIEAIKGSERELYRELRDEL